MQAEGKWHTKAYKARQGQGENGVANTRWQAGMAMAQITRENKQGGGRELQAGRWQGGGRNGMAGREGKGMAGQGIAWRKGRQVEGIGMKVGWGKVGKWWAGECQKTNGNSSPGPTVPVLSQKAGAWQ